MEAGAILQTRTASAGRRDRGAGDDHRVHSGHTAAARMRCASGWAGQSRNRYRRGRWDSRRIPGCGGASKDEIGRPRGTRDLSVRGALDRGRDGCCAAADRALAQHQGASRLFLRSVRWARARDRHGRPHAGASWLHADERAGGDCGHRVCAGRHRDPQRSLRGRNAFARHHDGAAGVS